MPRPKVDLEPWKPQITQWVKEGKTCDDIRRILWKEDKIQISEKTFRTRLREWNVHVRQPYLDDIEALRKRVREIFNEGRLKDAEAVQALKNEGFDVKAKTYQKMRKDMGLYKRSQPGFKPLNVESAPPAEAGAEAG